jgi:hypothetical protein
VNTFLSSELIKFEKQLKCIKAYNLKPIHEIYKYFEINKPTFIFNILVVRLLKENLKQTFQAINNNFDIFIC